ncbi:hypothetical protein J2S90_002548 [Arthrobacter bambusae]|uniref:Uncharacterized protein n=1 Tax=Arthrobacter bambusae TaxID=1338426 RepID=A0AAW8DHT3_9MICC|nr:hypothetical protein [Arthrobacter bambusae]MDQ0127341.1 hypothetical protein [Arthrobacter bambusae]MDQ0178683.1 hypothetical protein [Arthrobacter bambusae]
MDEITSSGRTVNSSARAHRRRPHYIAATFWALITFGAVSYTFSAAPGHLNGIWIGLITLAYTIYLYRGGRWVLFIF